MATARQKMWAEASDHAAADGSVAAGLFALLAQPTAAEGRGHSCTEHARGFRSREGRRGFRCGICRAIVKWVDPE